MSNKNRVQRRLLRILAAAVLILAAVWILIVRPFSGIPSWVRWKNREETVSLMGEDASLRLRSKRFQARDSSGKLVWESEKGWKVSDYLIGDIDHDEAPEVILIVWKRGSYGEFRPFWVEKDETSYSEHIFIYDWDLSAERRMKPVWMSSKMRLEGAAFSLDENQVLQIQSPDGQMTLWNWEGWGLILQE